MPENKLSAVLKSLRDIKYEGMDEDIIGTGMVKDLKIDGDVVKECVQELRLPEEKKEKQKKQKIAAETQPEMIKPGGTGSPILVMVTRLAPLFPRSTLSS